MKFLACYENTSAGVETLQEAQRHARTWGADIEVVSTLTRELPIKHWRLEEKEEALEKEVAPFFSDDAIQWNVNLLTGEEEAGELIVRFAKRKKADLVFLGIKKKSRVGKLLFGSNAQFVILNAPCPVVTVCHKDPKDKKKKTTT